MVFLVFLEENSELRTDFSYRQRSQEEHHTDTSPFEQTSIDMIDQFPIDYMHLVCLGVTKLILKLWISICPKFSEDNLNCLSMKILKLSKYIPKEFNRKPRSLIEINRWKATEFRMFLLYISFGILDKNDGILSQSQIEHFYCLSCAIRIFCDTSSTESAVDYGNDLLLYFVQEFKNLYGKKYVVSNLHNLIHLARYVKLYGALDTFSAFPFENNMKFILKLLRKFEKPLQQLHRRVSENLQVKSKNCKSIDAPILHYKIDSLLPFDCINSHKQLQFENFTLTINRPDNCCLINDENSITIFLIDYIGQKNNITVVIGKKFQKISSLKNYPFDSTKVNIGYVSQLSDTLLFPVSTIVSKACLFTLHDIHIVVPLLHH